MAKNAFNKPSPVKKHQTAYPSLQPARSRWTRIAAGAAALVVAPFFYSAALADPPPCDPPEDSIPLGGVVASPSLSLPQAGPQVLENEGGETITYQLYLEFDWGREETILKQSERILEITNDILKHAPCEGFDAVKYNELINKALKKALGDELFYYSYINVVSCEVKEAPAEPDGR